MPSYEQNKSSKLWSCRFREFADGEWRQKRLSGYRTKKEAQAGYMEFVKAAEEAAKLAAIPAPSDRMLMSALVDSYLEYTKSRVKESSYYTVSSKVNKNIRPFFEGKYVDEIKPLHILEWQQTLDGYAFAHKNRIRNHLASIYRYGDKYYDIPNVMKKVDPLRNLEGKKEMLYWTKEDFRAFISQCDDIMFCTLFWLLYISGCRKSEALALSWDDVNIKAKTISINKSITRKHSGKSWAITTPKNISSNRVINIPSKLCRILTDYKKWHADNHKNSRFLFCGDHPIAEQTITRYFDSVVKKAGVKRIRIHDLRHSCASLLISEGISIVAVSKHLGHANIEQTLNTYSHLMPTENEKMISVLDNV